MIRITRLPCIDIERTLEALKPQQAENIPRPFDLLETPLLQEVALRVRLNGFLHLVEKHQYKRQKLAAQEMSQSPGCQKAADICFQSTSLTLLYSLILS